MQAAAQACSCTPQPTLRAPGRLLLAAASALASGGKSSLRFDFAGNRKSQGSFSFGNYWREVEDLRAAVLFVRQVVKENVYAIVGHSKGGNVVLLYGSKYDDVQHIVNIAGRGVMDRGIKERFGADILERLAKSGSVEQKVKAGGGRTVTYSLTKQAVDERMSLDMLGAAKNITAEVLTIYGTADTGPACYLGFYVTT
ncbi:hypothetical protein HYH03_006274 [Edaphochlamys debaryana]|uniref:Serine aminopeptidase S33 domain-containing protein n=1 Tax=Edaphochlamys debaryana TaxID=47281 RepID=A0A835Y5S5_9CHLO|nr:hypothetical protein HYH03_006274 [Edaphochlamys debaryana]|eukprot:KAG2495674.1 hypothetical protein HYH03_006274 [Edaphochlamys debaryana]